MVDPVEPEVPPAPAAAPASSETPIVESAVSAQADQAAAASPAPIAELPAVGAEVKPEPVAEPTLLDKFDEKKAEPKVEDKPAAEVKPEDKAAEPAKTEGESAAEVAAEPVAEVAAEPVAEAAALPEVDYFAAETGIKLPETITLDDTTRGELKTALDTFRADPIKGAQALIDMHAKQMADFAQLSVDNQWAVFRKMNEDSVNAVKADPIMGGAGHDTAMAQAAIARDNLASTAKPGTDRYQAELKEFNDDLRATGMGNRLSMLRFMHNAARYVREASLPPPNPKPPADIGKNPNQRGKALVYDNPTSQPTS